MNLQMRRRDFLKLAGLLSLGPLAGEAVRMAGTGASPAAGAPSVLILVFDAFSAQHMSLYGYPRQTTPNLARFAERATVYHRHYAGGTFTTPGTASLLTGSYPWSHRALHSSSTVADAFQSRNLFRAFAEGGYHTVAYTQNGWAGVLLNQFAPHVERLMDPGELCIYDGLFYDQLFPRDRNAAYWSIQDLAVREKQMPGSLFLSLLDRVQIGLASRKTRKQSAGVYPRGVPNLFKLLYSMEQTVDGLKALIPGLPRPFLAYFHVLPPHEPRRPSSEFAGRFDDGWAPAAKPPSPFTTGDSAATLLHLRQDYDEYVAYVDAQIGRLLDSLAGSGTLENTILVLTTDHGEMFERGIHGHGSAALYEPLVHIPLLISRPGQGQREDVRTPSSAVDLLPTLVDAAGLPAPDWGEGVLLPGAGRAPGDEERSVFAVDAKSNPKQRSLVKASAALIKGPYKLTRYWGYGGAKDFYELYDLEQDPEEVENLHSSGEPIAAGLQDELKEKLDQLAEFR